MLRAQVEFADDLLIVRFGEEIDHALGEHIPNPRNGTNLVDGRGAQGSDRAKPARQETRGSIADVADTEPVQQPKQGLGLRGLGCHSEVFCAPFTESFQFGDLGPIEGEEIGSITDPAQIDKTVGQLLAHAIDIHCTPGDKMVEFLPQP